MHAELRLQKQSRLDTAVSLDDLGALLQAIGDYQEAREQFQRALNIREKQLGSDHPDTARSQDNLRALLQADSISRLAKTTIAGAIAANEFYLA